MAHSPVVNRARLSPRRPPYLNMPDLPASATRCNRPVMVPLLNVNSVSSPSKPFDPVPMGRLCQALMFSIMTQLCQPKEKAQSCPAACSFAPASNISSQVVGVLSTPACFSRSLLTHRTGVEELNGSDSRSPFGVW